MSSLDDQAVYAEERKNAILGLLAESKRVSVEELSKSFEVSPVTIRKDLKKLEEAGLLHRTHGGAVISSGTRFELSSRHKLDRMREEKERIGKAAAELIRDGESIILDTGTTTLQIAKCLRDKRDLTVVVNDLSLASVLQRIDGIHLIVVGGSLRRGFDALVGPIAVSTLSAIHVDKAFLAVNGISVGGGLTTPDLILAETKRAMIQVAEKVIVVTDHTKIGAISFAQIAPARAVSTLITDSGVDPVHVKQFQDAGIEVVTA